MEEKVKSEVWSFIAGVVAVGVVVAVIWFVGPRSTIDELRAEAERVERDFERVASENRAIERQLELAHQAIARSRESSEWIRKTIVGVLDGLEGDKEVLYAIADGLQSALHIVDGLQAELTGNYRALGAGE